VDSTRLQGSRNRQVDDGRVGHARQRIAAFLDSIDPLWRKSLVKPGSLTPDEHLRVFRERPTAVRDQYERLLIEIPADWTKYCARQDPAYRLLREYILLGHVRRRGAPTKTPQQRESSIIAHLVEEAERELKSGCDLCRRLKSAGGAASDNTQIRSQLSALGYRPEQITAILRTRKLRSAAIWVVAQRTRKKVSTIRKQARMSPAAR
jgi:hypothetical protein